MRLHRLTITAFGPFAATETVDFDALAADGLFLVRGETGAGKTTVLDAVAFALFGRVPGARNDARRLRSDHAAPDVRPGVELDLTIGGSRVVVARSPEWTRPRKRGPGTTAAPATASLRWVDGSGRDPVTRAEEVARVTERLLGMSAEQFTQVVLLPQGDFARFLRAETAEREQLLERLFDTARFGRIEQWFRDRRTTAHRAVDAGELELEKLAARLAQVAGLEQPGEVDDGWLAATESALGARFAAAGMDDNAAGVELARLTEQRAAAEGRVRVLRRRSELADRQRAMAASAAGVAADRAELVAARRAAPVAVADASARSAAAGLTAAAVVAHRAHRAVGLIGESADDGAGLRELALGRREQAARLAELVDRLARARADRTGDLALGRDLAAAEEELRELGRRAAELPRLVAAARDAVAAATAGATRLPAADARVAASRTALDSGRDRDAHVADLGAEQAAETAARARASSAREHWLDLRERRLDGMAAELAGLLQAGQPCPVCGGTEHPAPARPAPTAVSEAAETTAVQRAEAAGADLAAARDRVARHERALAAARALVADTAVTDLQLAVTAALDDRAALATAARALPELTTELAGLEQEHARHHERVVAAGSHRSELVTRRAERAEAARRLAAEESAARGADADVPARRQRLLDEARVLTEAADAVLAEAAAQAFARERADESTDAAVCAGFADLAAARAAIRRESALAELAERVDAATAEAAALSHALADPELADQELAAPGLAAPGLAGRDLAGREPAELDGRRPVADAGAAEAGAADAAVADALAWAAAADTAAIAAATELQQTRHDLALSEQAATVFAGLAGQWRRRSAGHRPIRAAYQELAALTDTLDGRGQNREGLSLRSYVLAERLDQVTAAASDRLGLMTAGRYALSRGSGTGRRGAASGLGIDVLDSWTGVLRPAKTLSGGESFLASLALALALADVVSAESGGLVMDTLFVDEGFGSLDSETLELVMGTLEQLRAGGRVVGLVSHVAELHDRIPTQLYVRRTRTGSTLTTTAA